MALAITTLLTIGTQAFNTMANEPRVSYIKAMNVWMAGCLLGVFLALVEFAVVQTVYARARTKAAQLQVSPAQDFQVCTPLGLLKLCGICN